MPAALDPLPPSSLELGLAVEAGWLRVVLGQEGETVVRLSASYLTPALDDLLVALVRLTWGDRHIRVSWDGEPVEFRWLLSTLGGYVHVELFCFDRWSDLFRSEGRQLLSAELPLRSFVRTVAGAARALVTELGGDGYHERWHVGPFPFGELAALETWLGG